MGSCFTTEGIGAVDVVNGVVVSFVGGFAHVYRITKKHRIDAFVLA